MTEHDLKRALRDAMAATEAPPPMSEVTVLEAAKQSQKHRRAAWAGGASAVAVAAIAVSAVLIGGGGDGDGAGAVPVGGRQSSTTDTPTSTVTSSSSQGSDTETPWPDGQTDRTASSGPHYDQGVSLDKLVEEVVPEGYETPTDLTAPEGFELRSHQAQFREYVNGDVNGDQVWEYYASVPVVKDGGTGTVFVMVVSPGDSTLTGEGCEFADVLWDEAAECEDVTVDDGTVGLATGAEGASFDTWAGYRHDDGTVVYVGQALVDDRSGLPPLAGPVFTPEQLAALAADPRFHLE